MVNIRITKEESKETSWINLDFALKTQHWTYNCLNQSSILLVWALKVAIENVNCPYFVRGEGGMCIWKCPYFLCPYFRRGGGVKGERDNFPLQFWRIKSGVWSSGPYYQHQWWSQSIQMFTIKISYVSGFQNGLTHACSFKELITGSFYNSIGGKVTIQNLHTFQSFFHGSKTSLCLFIYTIYLINYFLVDANLIVLQYSFLKIYFLWL